MIKQKRRVKQTTLCLTSGKGKKGLRGMKIKRLLIKIHKNLIKAQLHLSPLACMFLIFLGISILLGKVPDIDISKYPVFLGYVFLYGGFLLFLVITADRFFSVFRQVKVLKKVFKKKTSTLAERVKQAEDEMRKERQAL
jgi:hypothetical protein